MLAGVLQDCCKLHEHEKRVRERDSVAPFEVHDETRDVEVLLWEGAFQQVEEGEAQVLNGVRERVAMEHFLNQ